jgi:hypothetical protein
LPSNPYSASPLTRTHAHSTYLLTPTCPSIHTSPRCPYVTIGTDITISYTPPCPTFALDSPDVLCILSANADLHLQVFEKQKLCRGNKRDPDTGARINGDDVIGDLLEKQMTLIPFAIDPFGCIGPLARTFLFGMKPAQQLFFPASRPQASEMHRWITSFTSPVGFLPHAGRAWSTTRPHTFYGHSFTALTPSLSTVQNLGLCICKSFASHTIYACQKFRDRPPVQNSQRPDPFPVPITDEDITADLKRAATVLDYPIAKVIAMARIDTHSLHSGGANALSLAGFSDTQIQKMGRWRGATFKEYMHKELACFSKGMSTKMKQNFHFVNVAGNSMYNITENRIATDYKVNMTTATHGSQPALHGVRWPSRTANKTVIAIKPWSRPRRYHKTILSLSLATANMWLPLGHTGRLYHTRRFFFMV